MHTYMFLQRSMKTTNTFGVKKASYLGFSACVAVESDKLQIIGVNFDEIYH